MRNIGTTQKRINVGTLVNKVGKIKGELVWVLIGQAAGVLGSILSVRLMTGLLPPSVYGELALGLTAAALVNESIFGPLTNGIIRFYSPAKESNDVTSYLGASRRLVLFASLAVVLLEIVVATGMHLLGQTRWIWLILATLFYSLLYGYNGILSGVQNAARQRSIVALHQGAESWTRFLCATGLILVFGVISSIAMVGYTLGIIVVLCSQYIFFRAITRQATTSPLPTNWQQKIVSYSWPFCTWSLFTWSQISSDRWALGLFTSTRDVGLYAALYQLGNYPVTLATVTATQLLAPILFQHAGHGQDKERNRKVNRYSWQISMSILGLTCVGALIALLLHQQIFHLLVSPKYAPVSPLLPLMLLSSGLWAAGQTVAYSLLSQLKTQKLIAAKITTAIVGIGLNFAGARWYGVKGVVVGGLLFGVIHFAWLAALSRWEEPSMTNEGQEAGL